MRDLHAVNPAPERRAPEVPGVQPAATSSAVQGDKDARRAASRAEAKRIAREAGTDLLSAAAFADALGTSHSHGKKMYAPDDDTQPLALGDVLAVARENETARQWAERVLDDCLHAIRERQPLSDVSIERLQRLATRDGGTFADLLDRALRDDRIDRDEARALLTVARQNRDRWQAVCSRLEALL